MGEALWNEHLGERGRPPRKAEQLLDGRRLHLALDEVRQVIGSAHGNVHAQFFQHCGVFGVVHPGHRALDLEHLLCKLAYDQIVFVPARYRNHGAAVSHVRTFLHFGKSAVAAHHGQV